MAKQRAIVEISQSRLEVALIRGGRVSASRSERIELGAAQAWGEGLKQLNGALSRLVEELDLAGAEATVLYWSPSAVSGVYSCAKSAGAGRALNAARLALADSAGSPLESNPHALVSLAADAKGGEEAQTHTLGVFERDGISQMVRELVVGAGLEIGAMVPIDAPAILLTARAAMKAASGAVRAVLYVGEHGSVLAGVAHGRMKFLRQIALGTESLASALAREIRSEAEGKGVRLEIEAARELLAKVGVPGREQMVMPEHEIKGSSVLPLLQPVLQRWLVEIKQSLRFGFTEAERGEGKLVICGCGANVPRLGEIMAEQCELSFEGADGRVTGAGAAWLAAPDAGLNLLPKAEAGARERYRLTRGMWVGAGAATLLIAADAVMTRTDIARVRTESRDLQARLDASVPALKMQEELIGLESGLAAAKERMAAQGAAVTSWAAVLTMLARETPERVRLTDVRLGVENGNVRCRVAGETLLEGASERLKGMLERLSATPVVREGRMGAVQRGESAAGPVQQFEMVLVLTEFPGSAAPAGRVAGAEEAGDE